MAKILFVWKSPFPWDIRVEKFCSSLSEFGNNVILLARWNGENYEIEEYKNFIIQRVGFNENPKFYHPFPGNPLWKKQIKLSIEKYNPDLILVREFFLVDVTRKAIGRKDIPLIFDMAEHYPEAMRLWRKYNSNFLRHFLMHKFKLPDKFEKKAVKLSDALITVCLEQKHRLVHQYSIDDSYVEVVHNTPKLEWFEKIPKIIKLPPRNLGYHGNLTLDKPIQMFVEYFAEVVQNDITRKLFIAGDGEFFDELKSIVYKFKNTGSIVLLGKYSFNKLSNFLSNIDIGVVPYKRNGFVDHTLTNKLFDYFAAGRPVIVSDSPPMARVIKETKSGLIINIENEQETKDILQNLDKYDWEQMSKNAYYWAKEKYNWNVDSIRLWEFIIKFL